MQSRSFPFAFKMAHIVPIPKKNAPDVQDFRPISILPIVGKIFEQLVLDNVKKDLINCYSSHQYAYRTFESTTAALVDMQDAITRILDSRDNLGARILFLDLSKAFDGLQHNRLVNYLRSYLVKDITINSFCGLLHTCVVETSE